MTLELASVTSLKALQAQERGVARRQRAGGPVGVACHSGRCLLFRFGRRLGRLSRARHGAVNKVSSFGLAPTMVGLNSAASPAMW
jgi:hypothetical protein